MIYSRILKVLVAVLVISCALLYTTLYTSFGLSKSIQLIKLFFPSFTVASVTGHLGNEVVLNRVQYEDANIAIQVEQLKIQWAISYLLHRQFWIKQLAINGLKVNIKTASTKATNIHYDWERLKRIYIEELNINQFRFYIEGQLRTNIKFMQLKELQPQVYNVLAMEDEGRVFGTLYLHINDSLKWQTHLITQQLDLNSLWLGTKAIVSLNLNSSGEFKERLQQANLNLSEISGNVSGYPLKGQLQFSWQHDVLFIPNINLHAGQALIKVSGQALKNWDLVWSVSIPRLHDFHQNLRGEIQSTGQVIQTGDQVPIVNGNLVANHLQFGNATIANIQGRITSSLAHNMIIFNGKLMRMNLKGLLLRQIILDAKTKISNDNVHTVAIARMNQRNQLLLNVYSRLPFSLENTIKGRLDAHINDLSNFIKTKAIQYLAGNLIANLAVNGTINNPLLSGLILFQHGKIRIRELGIVLQSLNIRGKLSRDYGLHLSGEFQSGGGVARLESVTNLSSFDTTTVLLTGNRLEVAKLASYHILATPHLNIRWYNDGLFVDGTVDLPYIKVNGDEINQAITLPNEVIFVDVKPKTNLFRSLDLNIQLNLGDQVYIAYKNLKANLAGHITVTQQRGGMPSANGELYVNNGTYKIYDKLFSINEGRLIYVGNLISNPGLDIRAIREWNPPITTLFGITLAQPNQVRHLKVGVRISGTLDNPVVSLYSEPPMSQDDILSYIVFGQSRQNISGAGALSVLGSLAADLNLSGPTMGDKPNPWNGLFGIFRMGLFNSSQTLAFNFPLTDFLSLQTEASINETGADLLYTKEIN